MAFATKNETAEQRRTAKAHRDGDERWDGAETAERRRRDLRGGVKVGDAARSRACRRGYFGARLSPLSA